MSVLRLEYNLFQARLGQAYQLKVIPDEEDEDAQLISVTPMETYLQDSSIPTDEDKDFIPYIKPELESISDTVDKSTMSLVNMLSDLKLKELSPVKVKVKLEDEQHIYYFPRQQSAKKIMKSRVGVPIHVQGSSVTVLTPIKASKKLQNGTLSLNLELGVECVITPVRRSLRFHDDDDYTSSAAKPESVQDIGGKELRNPTKDEKVRQLLEEHEFAYVPNKVNIHT